MPSRLPTAFLHENLKLFSLIFTNVGPVLQVFCIAQGVKPPRCLLLLGAEIHIPAGAVRRKPVRKRCPRGRIWVPTRRHHV